MTVAHNMHERLHTRAIWQPIVAAIVLYLVNNLGIVGGWLLPPDGYVATFMFRGGDIAAYTTWINAYRIQNLLPNYHAPWYTEPGLFTPIPWLIAQSSLLLGISSVLAYHLIHFLFYLAASCALFLALKIFTENNQEKLFALLFLFLSVPLAAFLLLPAWILTSGKWTPLPELPGLGNFVWWTSDGFFHGISGSIFVTFGTATALLALVFLGRYIATGQSRYLGYASLTACISAFAHPYEVVVIVAAGSLALALYHRRAWTRTLREILILGLGAAIGLLPMTFLALTHGWVRDAAETNRWSPLDPSRLLIALGLPTILALFLLPARLKMAAKTDTLLQSWFVVTLVAIYVPWMPWTQHLLDGFLYVAALLLARQTTQVPFLRVLQNRYPRMLFLGVSTLCILSLSAYIAFYRQSFHAGYAIQPGRLLNTVAPIDEVEAIAWLRENAASDELVLAPPTMAPWFATVPMRSFASHFAYSLTYEEQSRLATAFYAGTLTSDEVERVWRDYHVRYVVVPANSLARVYLEDKRPEASFGSLSIYSLDDSTF